MEQINSMLNDTALKASHCSVNSLNTFEASSASENRDWIWPGLLEFQGLDDALGALIECAMAWTGTVRFYQY